jgi:putative ABC transport system permease protein
MIRNYLRTALRSIRKNKVFSMINITGLAIGMAGSLLLLQYIQHELSYDRDQTKGDRIFRVQQDRYNKGELTTRWAAGCTGIGPDLKANFPEVKEFVRMHESKATMASGSVTFREDHMYFASDKFFEVFSFKLLRGVDSLVLREPFTIVLSESMARKYFHYEDPVGKILKADGNQDYAVTGVFADLPENSHMRFDALMSFSTYFKWVRDPNDLNSYQWDGFMTYILLDDKANPGTFESKLPAFVEKQKGEELKRYNAGMVFHLEPITSIHLYSNNMMMDFGPNGNGKAVYFLGIISVFILIIAWINYINLATARSMERAREVGVRKVMGSFRSQLIKQFLLESLLVNLVAFGFAIFLVWILLPYFSELSGRLLNNSLIATSSFWYFGIALFASGVVMAGIYPAFVMSGFKPVLVLKGHLKASTRGTYLRKGLVVFQFIASITLIVGTFTVYRQLSFMQNSNLGVNINQTLVVKGANIADSTYVNRFEAFRHDLESYPEIVNVSASTTIPGRQPDWNAGGIRKVGESSEQGNQYRVLGVDWDFVKTFELKLAAGRDFSRDHKTDVSTVLFNESAVKLIGFKTPEEALNEPIYFWGDTFKIVGVLKDYRQESLKKNFEPLIFRLIPDVRTFYSMKIKTSNMAETLRRVEQKFNMNFPGNPFEYFFLDDYYSQQYQADQQFGKVFGVFASLAIFIACLGLFGLSSYTVVQRTKEIGVRKVLGASVSQVVGLLCKDFALLVIIAMFIAIPVSWLLMNNWLSEFATRISLSWWIFLIPCVTVVVIAWITISVHTFRAAATNPAESLRYE